MNADEKQRYVTRMRVQRYRAVKKVKKDSEIESSALVLGSDIPSTSTASPEHLNHRNERYFINDNSSATSDESSHIGIQTDQQNSNESGSNIDSNNDRNSNLDTSGDRDSDTNSSDTSGDSDSDREFDERHRYDGDRNHEPDVVQKLQKWAIDAQIQHTHLDNLLEIISGKFIPELPKSSKTFLRTTSAMYEIQEFRSADGRIQGRFVYFGIANNLEKQILPTLHENHRSLYLQFNVDGMPLFKSSNQQLWPILCKMDCDPDVYKPFPVAIYVGSGKPNDVHKYFEEFVVEMSHLVHEGIVISGRHFEVDIKSFTCDRPARSFIKCIKNHGGYYACERCTVAGERHNNRVVYVSMECGKRTNESFRNQSQPSHHTGISPLLAIQELDMVNHFVLDFMHLGYLGITKKFLDYWLDGSRKVKFSQNTKLRLSQHLLNFRTQVPQDFQRTTRSLTDIAKWKATEFRFFLLYLSPIILKDALPNNLYKHFLLFHTASRILCSEEVALKFNGFAKSYLQKFVKLAENFYGHQCHILNMHSLIHVTDDVENMKCSLNKITAFPFESTLGKIKKMVRSGKHPLSQICRRFHEEFITNAHQVVSRPDDIVILKKKRVPLQENTAIKKLRYKASIITDKSPDNVVLLRNNQVLRIQKMFVPDCAPQHAVQINGIVMAKIQPIFEYPCNSEILKMWKVRSSNVEKMCVLEDVMAKMTCLRMNNGNEMENIYVMPLLH